MSAVTVLLIAVGLAMDAFAVSVASGTTIKRRHLRNAVKFGFFFGSFQMIMPLIGWTAGSGLRNLVTGVDHWIVFGLLAFIGGKMMYESFNLDKAEDSPVFGPGRMLLLSIATSIDALTVGLSFAFLAVSIVAPVFIIGAVTFVLSFLGVFLGNTVGHFFERKLEFAGGLILMGIGLKILLEHLL